MDALEMTDPAEAKYNIWNDDCVEFMGKDWTNNGSVPSQYRVNRSGIATRDWDTQNVGFTAAASAGSDGWRRHEAFHSVG